MNHRPRDLRQLDASTFHIDADEIRASLRDFASADTTTRYLDELPLAILSVDHLVAITRPTMRSFRSQLDFSEN